MDPAVQLELDQEVSGKAVVGVDSLIVLVGVHQGYRSSDPAGYGYVVRSLVRRWCLAPCGGVGKTWN